MDAAPEAAADPLTIRISHRLGEAFVHRIRIGRGSLSVPFGTRAVATIKGVHTAAFGLIAGSIVLFTWEGVTRRPGRGTVVTAGIAFVETLVYVSNNQVCPLTPLAGELGDEHGTVTDLFLPGSVSRRIPLVAGSALLAGLALQLFGWWDRRRA